MGNFVISPSNSPDPIFSPFWETNFVRAWVENAWAPHKSFLSLSQPNNTQTHFLSKIFHSPYFTSKQTHPKVRCLMKLKDKNSKISFLGL